MDQGSNGRLDRIEASLEKLTSVVKTFAASVDARDDRIDARDRRLAVLIELAGKHDKVIADLEKQWQAYLSTIHRKQ